MSINIIESYEINGKLYVNTAFLCAFFSKDSKTIGRWKKDGLPKAIKPKELKVRGDFYFLDEVQKWVQQNINPSKSNATKKKGIEVNIPTGSSDDIEETVNDIQGKISQANEMLQLKGTTHDDADRIKKILDGLIQAVRLGEQTKDLIPKKDTEKVIIEFIVTLIAGYKKDIKILPKECENRDEKSIRMILENNYKSNVEKYQKMAKSDIVSDSKLYDVMEEISELVSNGISVDTILEKLK